MLGGWCYTHVALSLSPPLRISPFFILGAKFIYIHMRIARSEDRTTQGQGARAPTAHRPPPAAYRGPRALTRAHTHTHTHTHTYAKVGCSCSWPKAFCLVSIGRGGGVPAVRYTGPSPPAADMLAMSKLMPMLGCAPKETTPEE